MGISEKLRCRLICQVSLLVSVWLLPGCTILPGCMIPTYHQPQGFSSTYYRHLQQVSQAPPLAGPEAIPPAELGKTKPPKPIETADSDADADKNATAAKPGNWWSWLRSFQTKKQKIDEDDVEASQDAPTDSAAKAGNTRK
jgi:hypothetical protein